MYIVLVLARYLAKQTIAEKILIKFYLTIVVRFISKSVFFLSTKSLIILFQVNTVDLKLVGSLLPMSGTEDILDRKYAELK